MAIIDTHAHLYLDQFSEDLDQVVQRARDARIEKVLLPNIDETSIEPMFALVDEQPGFFFPMLGLHPCSVKKDYKEKLDIIYKYVSEERIYAIGETGLDYHWDKNHIKEQKDSFLTQIKWAKEMDLPIVIHSRESIDDCIKLIESNKDESLNGVFHCFSGTMEQAGEIQKNEFIMGIGGVVTFKNSGLDKLLHEIPMDHIVLETDSPYLSPEPFRGKRNESSYLKFVIRKVADIYQVEEEEVEETTSRNAKKLFFGEM